MPDAPDKPFDLAAIARQKEARKNSPLLGRYHPYIRVCDFMQFDYEDQRRADRESEEVKAKIRKWIKPTEDTPGYWLIKNADGEWVPPTGEKPPIKVRP